MQSNASHQPALDPGQQHDPDSGPQAAIAGVFASLEPTLFSDVIASNGATPSRFMFAYGQLPVIGELWCGPDRAELRLLVVVGRLPYSVESREERRDLLTIVRNFPADLGASLVIASDQSICVSTTATLESRLTAAELISALVVRLLTIEPELTALADLLPDLAPALGRPAKPQDAGAPAPL